MFKSKSIEFLIELARRVGVDMLANITTMGQY